MLVYFSFPLFSLQPNEKVDYSKDGKYKLYANKFKVAWLT